MKHTDKPRHQRWLYQLADIGLFKAILLIWGVCWATIIAVFAILKIIFGHVK